jgi:ABC-2 type transport system permease protein
VIAAIVALIGSIRDLDLGGDALALIVGGALVSALYAGLGVGIGAIVRNQVGAIIGVLVWLFVLENLITLIPGVDDIVAKYGLNSIRAAAAGAEEPSELLNQLPATLVLTGYVLLFMAGGLMLMRRRDITA